MRTYLVPLVASLLAGLASSAVAGTYTITKITYPGTTPTLSAEGINNSGEIVGEYGSDYDDAYSYIDNKGVFSTITVANGTDVSVEGINNLGQVVGSVQINHAQYAFADLNGIATPINVSNLTGVVATGINDFGEIVGSTGGAGFSYKNGIATSINFPGASLTYAYGVNNAGEIVGEYADSNYNYYGFTYINGVFSTFIDPQDPGAIPVGINNKGEIIGVGAGQFRGLGFTDIDGTFSLFPGFIQGVNDLGDLVGTGGGSGFEAIPTPEPSTGVLIGAIGLLLCAKRTLRRRMITRKIAGDKIHRNIFAQKQTEK